ncbi:hypothetical protein ACHAXR_012083 [Thalassiosira sp. AJA248-18]
MSEFASMLASFKQNATSASSSSNQQSSTPSKQARKRPHPNANVPSAPYFPAMHSHSRKNNSFELSFLIIGAQKAGTSWLHTLLQKCHRLALPIEQKEVHFWDWHYRKGFDWYIRQFDYPQKLSHKADDPSHSNNPLYGEITPCYVVLQPTAIAEIHNCFPNLKVIFVARDLVDRAWSAMIMELRDQTIGLNPGEFAKGSLAGGKQQSKRARKFDDTKISVAQQRRLQQQSSPSSQPDSYYIDRLRSETHTSRSDYATRLSNWYSQYPSENILILDYTEIENHPRDVLLKVVMHIGVDEKVGKAYVKQLSDEDVLERVNAATNAKADNVEQNATPLASHHCLSGRPRLRKQMEEYLRPYAVKFNRLLKEKGYSWKLNEHTG